MSTLIQSDENKVHLHLNCFIVEAETIIGQMKAAQFFRTFMPEANSFDICRHIAALFFILKKLTQVEDQVIEKYICPTQREEATLVLNSIAQIPQVREKLTRGGAEALHSIEALKVFLNQQKLKQKALLL